MSLLLNLAAFAVALTPGATVNTGPQDKVDTSAVTYKVGNDTFEGFIAVPTQSDKPVPAVIIFHDWNGLDDYEEMRAKMFADLGYIGFAADVYGAGNRPKTTQENQRESGKLYSNPALLRERVNGSVAALLKNKRVDPKRIFAIGYCFGGMCVLELARTGANVAGVGSFHGSLATKTPMPKGAFKGEVMVYHGNADPLVPKTDIDNLKAEMKNAGAKFQFIGYEDAVHAFTVKGQERVGNSPVGYNEAADKGSWNHLKGLLKRLFGT